VTLITINTSVVATKTEIIDVNLGFTGSSPQADDIDDSLWRHAEDVDNNP
jgi:hypothetical protein